MHIHMHTLLALPLSLVLSRTPAELPVKVNLICALSVHGHTPSIRDEGTGGASSLQDQTPTVSVTLD